LASQQAGKAQWICLNGAMTSNGLFGTTTVPKAECPFITEYCGKQKDLTYASSTAISSQGLRKGEVCAWELDPTIRKPVIHLNGDSDARLKIKEVEIEVPDEAMLLDANSSVNFLKSSGQTDEWDQYYNEENAAFNALDANHEGAFIDVNTQKRFRPFVDLRNLPIN
jgi:hypothetical protein